jgi:hypothetical protein
MFIEKTEVTPQQRASLGVVETKLHTLLLAMRTAQPDELVWFRILKTWDGQLRLGSRLLTPSYTPETGRLTLGLDADGSPTRLDRGVLRCLNELVVKTAARPNCTPLVRQAVEAAEEMGIRVDLTCDDFREYGLLASSYYTAAGCTLTHDRRRPSFEELLGRNVDEAAEMVKTTYPDMHIALRKWDLIGAASSYDLHAEKETLIIYYDDVSKKVVLPEPRLASVQAPNGVDDHCFMMPDEGRCLGAPRVVQKDWDALIGGLVSDVADSLRFEYPHAVVEVSPVTYKIPPTRRMDRIRVSFDPSTARVVAITVG